VFALIEALPAGNAVRFILAPPADAAAWKVLRRIAQAPTGPTDPDAVLVADWSRAEAWLDDEGLTNGIPVHYRVFYRDAAGAPLLPHAPAVTVTPAATARDTSASPLRLVRRRIEAGLAVAVAAGLLRPASGRVPILLAPMADPNKITLPIVSVHLESDRPLERGLADAIAMEDLGADGWDETTGWLSEVQINVVGVSLNPDERITLGEVLKHIIQTNMSVFAAHGLLRPAFSVSHSEMPPETTGAPLYVAAGTLTCLAPSTFTATSSSIVDAVATVTQEDSP
jgi:hypothetical protein